MIYNGIRIERSGRMARISHSRLIEANDNTDYLDILENIEVYEDVDRTIFNMVSRVFSVVDRHYEICNGGVSQYYDNGYDEPRPPYRPGDCARFGIAAQKNFLNGELYAFAEAVLDHDELKDYERFLEATNRPVPRSYKAKDRWDTNYFAKCKIFETVIELYAQYVVKLARSRNVG